MSIKKLLIMSYFLIIMGILILGGLNILMKKNENILLKKQEQRYQSYLLADQLRQSSDDLTRMARTYVITGDSQYEKMYWDILAIRNGEKARPQHYNRIYWDFMLIYGDKPRPDGQIKALKKLMRETGFNDDEFAQLHKAQENSDHLVTTEIIAMNAVKGLYDDGTGHYVKKGKPNLEMARRIMHDVHYHKDKADIMAPIDQFFQLLDKRTQDEVKEYIQKTERLLLITQIMVIILIIISVILGIFVTTQILKAVNIVNQIANQMVAGQISATLDNQAEHLFTSVDEMGQIEQSIYAIAKSFKTVIDDIVQVSQKIAQGESITTQAEYKGEFIQIKNSLETASTKLAEITKNNVIQDWIKTGKTQLNEQMSGVQDVITLAKKIINFITPYVKAQIGVFYYVEDNKENINIKFLSSYAYSQSIATDFKLGEGLIGQAVLEKQKILVTDVPKDYIQIQSSLGKSLPKNILVIPFSFENVVKGVIELATVHKLTTVQQDFLEQVMPHIGIAVNTAESRSQMQALLQQKQNSKTHIKT